MKRPDAHPSHDDVARGLCDAIRAEVVKGNEPEVVHEMWTLSYEPRAKGWDARWGDRDKGIYKLALVGGGGLQSQAKCVWCEQLRSPRGELNVDHLRPKGKVTEWVGNPPEVADVPPKERVVHERGYWWLAYVWSNWNLACSGCNKDWKRCLLPRLGHSLPHEEGVEASEVLLLLDPASDFATRDHFRWNAAGYMFGKTEVGRATIITCGLNRPDLVERRLKVVADVLRALERFEVTLKGVDDAAVDAAAAKLAALGNARAEFAGMVRDLVETRLEGHWESLPLR